MSSVRKLLWNLFRLVLAFGFFGLLITAGFFLFRGQYQAAAAVSAVMSALFFSINVSNFWQYRWEEASGGAKAVVVAPVVMSLAALGVAAVFTAPITFSAVGVVVVFWFMVTRRRPDLRFSRVPVRLLIDDERIRLMYAHVQLDSMDWEQLVRVAVAPSASGPIDDDLFFVLEDDDGSSCVVPNHYARELLERLQRLEGFDNEGFAEALLLEEGEQRVLWEGAPGDARVCASSD